MAIHVKTNDESTLINRENAPQRFHTDDRGMREGSIRGLVGGEVFTLHALKKPLVVDGKTYVLLAVNAETGFSGLPFNQVATNIYTKNCCGKIGSIIVGDAVLFEAGEVR